MIRKRSVFVIGAGASSEFDLPVGSKLAEQISHLLNVRFDDWGRTLLSGDDQIWNILEAEHRGDMQSCQAACWRIKDGVGLAYSIDNFLDNHQQDELVQKCGRLAIAKAILAAERRSKLHFSSTERDATINFRGVSDTWVAYLFKMLQEGVRRDNVGEMLSRTTFIVFNYDRCVEHFLFHALRQIYSLSANEATIALSEVEILHPYGTVGVLPWQSYLGREAVVEFGADRAPVGELWRSIRTYTDQTDGGEIMAKCRSAVGAAEVIAFLGSSYQRQNLAFILPEEELKATRVIGTAYGLSEYNLGRVKDDLSKKISKGRGRLFELDRSLKCAALLADYSRAFTD